MTSFYTHLPLPADPPNTSPERRSSYSLERFLQEPEQKELSPASSIEARYLDTAEIALRHKRMQDQQSPVNSMGAYGLPPPGQQRGRPRLLLMGQRRYVNPSERRGA